MATFFHQADANTAEAARHEVPEMPQFVLQVSDARPVRFKGELLAEQGPPDNPGPFSRWHELKLYKTDSGKYVLQVIFRSNARNTDGNQIEPDNYTVFVCNDSQEVLRELSEFDPTELLVGYPEGVDGREEKQKRLKRSVCLDFDRVMGGLLADAAEKDPEFADEIT